MLLTVNAALVTGYLGWWAPAGMILAVGLVIIAILHSRTTDQRLTTNETGIARTGSWRLDWSEVAELEFQMRGSHPELTVRTHPETAPGSTEFTCLADSRKVAALSDFAQSKGVTVRVIFDPDDPQANQALPPGPGSEPVAEPHWSQPPEPQTDNLRFRW